jgi:transcriptional regulator with XRE-family HTH domain
MPDREWRKPEFRHALRERAAGTLLSLVQKHAGVSQARLATATGIGQGRLNEIINGHRQVARLDVLERIAGGLAMPNDARVLFGLAPVHADTLTGHAAGRWAPANQPSTCAFCAGPGLARGRDPGRRDRRVPRLVRGRDPARARPAGRVRRSRRRT